MDIHRKLFLDVGGDPEWLKGSEHLPPNLKSLLQLNSILAHRPWLLQSKLKIGELVQIGEGNLSLNELVHAIVIMAHFHALSCFVLGCGIQSELDCLDFSDEDEAADEGHGTATTAADGREPVASGSGDDTWGGGGASDCVAGADKSAIPIASIGDQSGSGGDGASIGQPDDTGSYDSIVARLKARLVVEPAADTEAKFQDFVDTDADVVASPVEQTIEEEETPLFRCEPEHPDAEDVNSHVDFDVKSKEYTVFRVENFSWTDQGYATLSRYNPELGELLEHEFQSIKSLTYEFMGEEHGIDTFKFRWAIWNYVLRIKGIVDDDYAYREVNTLLTRQIKSYVKTMVCFPQLTTYGQWKSYVTLLDSEKVHVCLIAMEARKQAELLYALQAVLEFSNLGE
jgi:sestrin